MITKLKAYVGTYTTGEGKGIYSFELNLQNGIIDNVKLEAELGNPTYLNIDKENKYLFSTIKKDNTGGVAAFSINPSTGELKPINYRVSEGSSPCHISLNSHGSYAFSANYHRGICEVYPLSQDGSVMPPSSTIVHEGSGPNKERQEKAHIHFSELTTDEKYLCVIDLGIDKLVTYSVEKGTLTKAKEIDFKPGSGPRHMAFHPNGKYAYVITELSSEVVVLEYDNLNGDFKQLQYISALPENFKGENLGSAIHLSPDGNYLYTSNRGDESIAAFSVDSVSGRLTIIGHFSTSGKHPRDFTIDPTGNYLIAANKDTNNLVPFLIDRTTGKLTQIHSEVSIPNPVCIKFINN